MNKPPKKIESKTKQTETGLTLNLYPGDDYLSEISQSMPVNLCLLERNDEKTFTEITTYVQCYDFLCDAYSSSIEKVDFGIYGFKWEGSKRSPDSTGIYLGVRFPNAATRATFLKNIHFLHAIEEKNGFPLTEFHSIGDNCGLSIGSTKWLANCLTLRLYLFLFRAFSYDLKTNDWITELSDKDFTDSQYVKNLERESWDKILSDLSSIATDYFCGMSFKADGTGAVHHNSGFFSTFSTHREINTAVVKKGKHWQEMKKRGFKLKTA